MAPKFYLNISAQRLADRYILYQDDYKNHRGIPALPFSRIHNIVLRPKPKNYPKVLKTIGDHLRVWRINNELLQKDIARLLNVCADSIVGWEIGNSIPGARYMPGIARMLGYLPVQIDTSTFGGRITYYRYMLGMTPKEFGTLVTADASTIRGWEKGKHIPTKRKRKNIEALICSQKIKY